MGNQGMHYALGIGGPEWMPLAGVGLLVLMVWSIFWKGLALWHSGRKGDAWWFIVLLLVNTLGILEMIYLLGVRKVSISNLFSK